MTIKNKYKTLTAISFAVIFILIIPIYTAYWINENYGFPLNNCDLFKKDDLGYKYQCFTEKINEAKNPDVRLCFKPSNPMGYLECIKILAQKVKDYKICEQIYSVTKNNEYLWACNGAVSYAKQDANSCDAPSENLKSLCRHMQGKPSIPGMIEGI